MKTTQTNSNNTNVRQASTNLVQTEEQQANCTASRHTLHEVSKDSGQLDKVTMNHYVTALSLILGT